jgi:hypothetical protein
LFINVLWVLEVVDNKAVIKQFLQQVFPVYWFIIRAVLPTNIVPPMKDKKRSENANASLASLAR